MPRALLLFQVLFDILGERFGFADVRPRGEEDIDHELGSRRGGEETLINLCEMASLW